MVGEASGAEVPEDEDDDEPDGELAVELLDGDAGVVVLLGVDAGVVGAGAGVRLDPASSPGNPSPVMSRMPFLALRLSSQILCCGPKFRGKVVTEVLLLGYWPDLSRCRPDHGGAV